MTSIQEKGVSLERIRSTSSISAEYLDCAICRDLLWKPVACQTCETPFCSPCIRQWLDNSPSKCPNRCEMYIERKCPPFIAKLLAQLQIACFYQSNGCDQVLPYEALEKHELECDYQLKQCPGCEVEMFKKDYHTHKSICELVKLTCKDCKLMYKRNEANAKHTENICLKKQIKRLKQESKESKQEIQKLSSQLTEIHKLQSFLTREMITFDGLSSAVNNLLLMPNKYRGLKWSKISYMHELFAIKKYPKSGYVTSFMPGGSLHLAFFSEEASIIADPPNTTFTLVSFSASAAWNDDLVLTIRGYRDFAEVNYHSVTLLFGRPQRISLQWKNIDKVVFKPSGGTAHPGSGESAGAHIALTQVVADNLSERKNNFLN